MKIAMYVPAWPPANSANGIVTYASYIVPALRALGHEVYLLTWQANELHDPCLVDLTKSGNSLPFWNRILFKISTTAAHYFASSYPLRQAIRELVTSRGVEIVEIEESFGLSYAVSRLNLIPVVVRLHGPWFLTKRFEDPKREKLEGRGIKSADLVTSPSRNILLAVKNYYRLQLPNARSFGNPIAPPSRQWQLSECDKASLLFIGRFDQAKGGDLIINAFGQLARRNPQLKLTFVGSDVGINGVKLFDYAKLILSPDALTRLNYKGRLDHTEISKLRTQHFITVCSSNFEVFPYAVLEAMSFGCPIIASNVGGIPEILRSEENGILFDHKNVNSLVSAVQSLLDDPSLAERIGRAARASIDDYKPEMTVALVVKLYEQTIAAFKRREPGTLNLAKGE